MILTRYFSKDILQTTLVISLLLVMIFVCNLFMRFMGNIADGNLALGLLFDILCWQIPFLLGYLLPIGFFFAVLLALGRFYAESEMAVLFACGFSEWQLLRVVFLNAFLVAAIVSGLVLQVGPSAMLKMNQALNRQGQDILLQSIVPGRFQSLPGENSVVYAGEVSRDRHTLGHIFMAQMSHGPTGPEWTITTAAKAFQFDGESNLSTQKWLTAENGSRYVGVPAHADFTVMRFGRMVMQLIPLQLPTDVAVKALSTRTLLENKKNNLSYEAEWQWRCSIPLSVLLMVFWAVPLARVAPRQGKFGKMLPAALFYILYANLLFVARNALASGSIPTWIGMGAIHLPILLLAVLLWIWDFGWLRVRRTFKAHT